MVSLSNHVATSSRPCRTRLPSPNGRGAGGEGRILNHTQAPQ